MASGRRSEKIKFPLSRASDRASKQSGIVFIRRATIKMTFIELAGGLVFALDPALAYLI